MAPPASLLLKHQAAAPALVLAFGPVTSMSVEDHGHNRRVPRIQGQKTLERSHLLNIINLKHKQVRKKKPGRTIVSHGGIGRFCAFGEEGKLGLGGVSRCPFTVP